MTPAGMNGNIVINSVAGKSPVPWDDTAQKYQPSSPLFPYWVVTPILSGPTVVELDLSYFTGAGQHMDFVYVGTGFGFALQSSVAVGGARPFKINWFRSLNVGFNCLETRSCFRDCLQLQSLMLDGFYPYYG